MTIAIAIVVTEGLVVSTDSASTLIDTNGVAANVYDGGNKLFNLCKGLPIAAATFGSGHIGNQTISTLAKDFRALLQAGSPVGATGWTFDEATYTIQEVTAALREFLFEDKVAAATALAAQGLGFKPGALGLLVGGYSAGSDCAEVWRIVIDDAGSAPPPECVIAAGAYNVTWQGDPDPVMRLMLGFGRKTGEALKAMGIGDADIPAAIDILKRHLEVGMAPPSMPMQDAIALADYLVSASIGFARFRPGANSIGGPIEIAAVSKHEGFKWVKRKHYFDSILNPNA